MITDIFCKIINGELKAEIVLEENDWLAIRDINPRAPVHILIIPKKHLTDLSEAQEQDTELLGRLLLAAAKVAKKLDLDYKGYRLILNHGEHGGQLVPHLHIHLLGGKKLGPKIVE